jgi:hypothetical protein
MVVIVEDALARFETAFVAAARRQGLLNAWASLIS